MSKLETGTQEEYIDECIERGVTVLHELDAQHPAITRLPELANFVDSIRREAIDRFNTKNN